MKKIIILFLVLASGISVIGQSPKRLVKKLGKDPVFFLDSVNIDKSEVMKVEPTDIASVTVFHGTEATDLMGEDGKDGVVYAFTKTYARKSYWNYFRTKSKDYADKVLSPEPDSSIQYVLNKRVLTSNFEGDLMAIDDKIFKEITVIDKETLARDYNVSGKNLGIVIKSDKPDNLYHANKKF